MPLIKTDLPSAMRTAAGHLAALLTLALVARAGGSTLVDHPIVSSARPLYLDGPDWRLERINSSTRLAASVPGDVLTDLQAGGLLPDPYWNTSWRDPAFIAGWNNGTWQYSKRFTIDPPPPGGGSLMVFDGVLMGATIQLNGHRLSATIDPLLGNVTGATDQFVRYAFPVGGLLESSGVNELKVTFGPAGDRVPGTSGGRFTFSTAIDWAPQMLTRDSTGRATFGFGIWRSVYVLPLPLGVAITQLVPHTFYAGGHPTSRLPEADHAGFLVNVTVELFSTGRMSGASVSVIGSWTGAVPVTQPVALEAGSNSVRLSIPADQTKAVRLWHPRGHGEQPLYNITATFSTASAQTVVCSRRIGFRHAALVTVNDTDPAVVAKAATEEGTGDFTMMFRVNGGAVYARGGSMIPMDLLNGRLSAEAHRRLVQSAAEGNFNTLRIWGGATYMPPAFYDACDEYGILLYHDLQFTGKATSVTFSRTVEAEILYNIKRLSHHPSIFLWDACNECKIFYPWWTHVLPTVVSVDTSRPIWPASPGMGWLSGVERLTSRPTGGRLVANPHWRGPGAGGFPWAQESHGPYTGFMRWVSNWTMPRAMEATVQSGGMGGNSEPSAVPSYTGPGQEGWAKSEFGANSWPSFESVSAQLPADQWSLGSAASKQRNWNITNIIDAFFGPRAAAAMHDVGEAAFKRQLYQSLIAQMLYLKTMIQSWRSTNIMISLWWMFNEIWPTGGWGSIEYGSPVPGQVLGGRWKPLHYEMRASTFSDHMATCNTAGACFATNDSPFAFEGSIRLRLLNVLDGTSATMAGSAKLSLPAGPKISHWFCASSELTEVSPSFPEPPQLNCTGWNATQEWKTVGCDLTGANCVLAIQVNSTGGTPESWSVVPFVPPKAMLLAPADVTATVSKLATGGAQITLVTNATALYVVLTTLAAGRFEDNAVLLEAGQPRAIVFIPWGAFNATLLETSLRIEHLADNM